MASAATAPIPTAPPPATNPATATVTIASEASPSSPLPPPPPRSPLTTASADAAATFLADNVRLTSGNYSPRRKCHMKTHGEACARTSGHANGGPAHRRDPAGDPTAAMRLPFSCAAVVEPLALWWAVTAGPLTQNSLRRGAPRLVRMHRCRPRCARLRRGPAPERHGPDIVAELHLRAAVASEA